MVHNLLKNVYLSDYWVYQVYHHDVLNRRENYPGDFGRDYGTRDYRVPGGRAVKVQKDTSAKLYYPICRRAQLYGKEGTDDNIEYSTEDSDGSGAKCQVQSTEARTAPNNTPAVVG